MAAFVTPKDKTIEEFSVKLINYANQQNYDQKETANFILRFIQESIDYESDEVTSGCNEFWRFPVETLVEKEGDCEDTSVLYSSILDNLGYDTCLIFYSWEEDGEFLGHLSVGVHLSGDHGSFVTDPNGKKYFYCETTTLGYSLGQLPPDLKTPAEKVIPI